MHILFLAPYPPYPPRSGGALRVYNLLRGLADQHAVTCLTFVPDAAAVAALEPLRSCCRVVTVEGPPRRSLRQRAWTTLAAPLPDMALRNAAPAYTAALRQLLTDQPCDVVLAASIEMAQYGLAAKSAGATPRIILDEFNAEYVLQRRAALTDLAQVRSNPRALVRGLYSLVQWRKLAAYERRLLRAYDRVLVVSAEDRRALQRLYPSAQPHIVPNGVDTHYFQPMSPAPPSVPPTLVFTGSLDFRPNIDAITWFTRHVLPLVHTRQPDTRFLIVGRAPAAAVRALHNGTTIEVVGEVADVRPFIAQAAVYVVPMRIGGGVRLKLLEALAMQAAVVSSTMGAEGVENLRAGEHLLLADTPTDFAQAILHLLDDPARRGRLGAAGRAFVCAQYDWQVIVPRLAAVI